MKPSQSTIEFSTVMCIKSNDLMFNVVYLFIQIYTSCVNCILSESGHSSKSIDDVKQGDVLLHLIDTLWPQAEMGKKVAVSLFLCL